MKTHKRVDVQVKERFVLVNSSNDRKLYSLYFFNPFETKSVMKQADFYAPLCKNMSKAHHKSSLYLFLRHFTWSRNDIQLIIKYFVFNWY